MDISNSQRETGAMENEIAAIAKHLRARNAIDLQIAKIINRPMTSGHLGEWIASTVFDIELEKSAVAAAFDGHFRGGPLAGKTVNVKWYLKREGILDTTASEILDYYLVMSGPKSSSASSAGTTRPWCITNVYLFDAKILAADRAKTGRKAGVASSVKQALWTEAEVYPTAGASLPLSSRQRDFLGLFGGGALNR